MLQLQQGFPSVKQGLVQTFSIYVDTLRSTATAFDSVDRSFQRSGFTGRLFISGSGGH